ncbi:transmembrane sensor [Variovorax sp. TBS-050B]|uniref:FecR domain-containing protein n=1 Tax=Variovorax sp. TBS-050B TaxID=2940551 RepID=UPI002475F622|nr:FecR domain-containing protein [Variovorax sp. TBS-050B]MDH6590321.1 transmembrane sensor [Variovorax sp. TBS-050B]
MNSQQPTRGETDLDPQLLSEAADWLLTLRYGDEAQKAQAGFDRWRRQSPAHGAAWARAEALLGVFAQVPAGIGRDALQAMQRPSRRRGMGMLGALLVAAPAGWLAWRHMPWREWTADVATATGERRSMVLADGSQLVLNTASAVDIVFTAAERRIRLQAGEILVTTHADPSPTYRPFVVQTAQGTVRALGTRFGVRRLDDHTTRVAVLEHAVDIRPANGASRVLRAGTQADFEAGGIGPAAAVESSATLWEQGMLLARNMRLADVVAEMGRYRSGVLRCHPAVADLRVSGAVSLADTDAGLALLARSLPLRIEQATRYWVTVAPR